MASSTYELFAESIQGQKQIVCRYRGHGREVCPILLGWAKNGEEAALVFQFAGETSNGPLAKADWKCFRLAGVSNVRLRDGPWYAGSNHSQRQSCVDTVDFDVNPLSPYRPRRTLTK